MSPDMAMEVVPLMAVDSMASRAVLPPIASMALARMSLAGGRSFCVAVAVVGCGADVGAGRVAGRVWVPWPQASVESRRATAAAIRTPIGCEMEFAWVMCDPCEVVTGCVDPG